MFLALSILSLKTKSISKINIIANASSSNSTSLIGNMKNGDVVDFGIYPQREVTDLSIINQLNSILTNTSWKSFDYYSGTGTDLGESAEGSMVKSDSVKYSDVDLNGVKYRAVRFTKARAFCSYMTNENDLSINDFDANQTYWFKYEPLEWIVLDETKGLLITKYNIDSQTYCNFAYSNYTGDKRMGHEIYSDVNCTQPTQNYETSSIREWLNDSFYQTAFSSSEKKAIHHANMLQSTGEYHYNGLDYTINNPDIKNDYVFLLSYSEYQTYFQTDESRSTSSTDYSKINGNSYRSSSWTRSYQGYHSVFVSDNGGLYVEIPGKGGGDVTYRSDQSHCADVRPAILLTNNYQISYNANGGTGTPSAQTKTEGIALTLSSSKPTKSYLLSYNATGGSVTPASKSVAVTFKNWNTKQDGTGTSYAPGGTYTADADATLYAQWTNPKAGDLATPTRSGYTFAGWYTAASGGTKITKDSTITTSQTLYAHWTQNNIYNLGEETYSFENFGDSDSPGGHCFGMSITSSGYYMGILDQNKIGGNSALYSFTKTETVKAPICKYQKIQGDYSAQAIVAGGSFYLTYQSDIISDWTEAINYVKNHEYDNKGSLQIGFRKEEEGGHAINFLRYERVNGQDRIYAYDNNFPTVETYFYQNAAGQVYQAPVQTFSGAIDCFALRDVNRYFEQAGDFNAMRVIYVARDAAKIQGMTYSYMEGVISGQEYVMYEIPENYSSVKIIPLEDNADFIYMDREYSFGKITDDTYGEFRLKNLDENGVTQEALFTIYNTSNVAVGTPKNVSVKPTANKTLTVSWTAVSGATQYNVYRYNGTSKTYVYKGTTFATAAKPTEYVDKGLNAGTTYYYKVVAVDKSGSETLVSDMSAAAHAKAVAAPAVPTGVAAKATGDKALTVSWKAVSGATQYNVYRYNGTKKEYVYKGTTFATAAKPTQYVDSGLNAGTTYYYKVVAVTKDAGLTLVSAQSAAANAKAVGTPAVPTGVAVKATADKTLTVSWKAVPRATQYNVYRYNGSTKTYVYKGTTIATVANPTQYVDSGLNAGTTYYYKVVAVTKDAGLTFVSAQSAAANAKAIGAPAAPDTVTATGGTGKITLFWSESTGATQYNVYRYNGTKKEYVYKGTSYGTSYADTTVAAGTTYYYKVVAVTKNSGLTLVSDYSAAVNAKAK